MVAAILIAAYEEILPYEIPWKPKREDLRLDTLHVFSSQLLPTQIMRPAVLGFLTVVGVVENGQSVLNIWPNHWPFELQFILEAICGDFGAYWVHRWAHEIPALWRLHSVHHSVPGLYWLNASRFHPLDTALSFSAQMLTLLSLGVGSDVLVMWTTFSGVHSLFQHCNVDLKAGPLNWIFSMAEPHRWHHSKILAEADHNYGPELVIWDHVFRTFYLPGDRRPPQDIGYDGMETMHATWFGQVTRF